MKKSRVKSQEPEWRLARVALLLTALWAPPAVAADHVVNQKDKIFSHSEITIKPGDTVTFKNGDEVSHNVYSSTPGMEFEIRRQAPGASSTVPFPKAGKVDVQCSIHPKMKLTVHVK